MFNSIYNIDSLNKLIENTLAHNFEIVFTEIGVNYICAKMPVTHKTVQPARILHGGASVALAETMGSIAAHMTLPDPLSHTVVGLEINANHIRVAKEGSFVFAKCTLVHVGRTTVICETQITNALGKIICISRMTNAVIPNPKP